MSFPKPVPSIIDRKQRKQAKAQLRSANYRAAYERDGGRCRACNDRVIYGSTDAFKRSHPHHLRFRSKGGQDDTANLATLCAYCHALVHAYRLSVAGTGDGALTFSMEGRTPWASWPASWKKDARS